MNRREMLAAAIGCAASVGVSVKASAIDAEPMPLCIVIECEQALSETVGKQILDQFKSLWKGPKEMPPVYICHGGLKIRAVREEK